MAGEHAKACPPTNVIAPFRVFAGADRGDFGPTAAVNDPPKLTRNLAISARLARLVCVGVQTGTSCSTPCVTIHNGLAMLAVRLSGCSWVERGGGYRNPGLGFRRKRKAVRFTHSCACLLIASNVALFPSGALSAATLRCGGVSGVLSPSPSRTLPKRNSRGAFCRGRKRLRCCVERPLDWDQLLSFRRSRRHGWILQHIYVLVAVSHIKPNGIRSMYLNYG